MEKVKLLAEYEEFYGKYYGITYNKIRKKRYLYINDEDLEEIINTAFNITFEKYDKTRIGANFPGYLYIVSYNIMRNFSRKNHTQIKKVNVSKEKFNFSEYANLDPLKIIIQRERKIIFNSILSSLDIKLMEIIKRKVFYDQSFYKISKIMSLNQIDLENLYVKAIDYLKQSFENIDYDLF